MQIGEGLCQEHTVYVRGINDINDRALIWDLAYMYIVELSLHNSGL